MTDQLSPLAVQNGPLLRAIGMGPHASPAALAEAAQTLPNNLARKIASLEAEGLITRNPDSGPHEVELTDLARRSLAAIQAFDEPPGAAGDGVFTVPLDLIDSSPFNPRTIFDKDGIEELGHSIADKGVLQPIIVRKVGARFEIVDGERRYRGAFFARTAGLVSPDFAISATLRVMTDDEAFEAAGVANLQRDDLHWMDEAEWYLALTNRGRSASQIERLVGSAKRKKRSIQERIQFARELSDVQKGLTRLPEGDPLRLTVDQCRAIVGNKRERPAIELTQKLAVTLLELVHAHQWETVAEWFTDLTRRPVGGAMTTLSDRKLISLGVHNGKPRAAIQMTDALYAWLRQLDYAADPKAALYRARVAVVGELAVGALAKGQYLTPELNPVEPVEDPDDAEELELDDERLDDGGEFGFGSPDQPSLDEAFAAERVVHEAAAPKPPELTPLQALSVIELAHRIERDADVTQGGNPVRVRDGYHRDPTAGLMVGDRLVMFISLAGRAGSWAKLTRRAEDWLAERGCARDDHGRFIITDESLLYAQVKAERLAPADSLYTVTWLSPDAPAKDPFSAGVKEALAAARDDDEPPPAHAVREPSPDDPVTVPRRVLTLLMKAARDAVTALNQAETRRLKPNDTAPPKALINAAISDAEAAMARTQQSEIHPLQTED